MMENAISFARMGLLVFSVSTLVTLLLGPLLMEPESLRLSLVSGLALTCLMLVFSNFSWKTILATPTALESPFNFIPDDGEEWD